MPAFLKPGLRALVMTWGFLHSFPCLWSPHSCDVIAPGTFGDSGVGKGDSKCVYLRDSMQKSLLAVNSNTTHWKNIENNSMEVQNFSDSTGLVEFNVCLRQSNA
jgi:hypothetical protein